jgi:hypothetical protein
VRLRTEVVDIAAVRRGSLEGRIALAKRIFALWQPIFSHLDQHDYTFHLQKHVEDHTAVQIRAVFGVDDHGRDQALVIVRVHEHTIGGRIMARLTINAGAAPTVVQRHFGQDFVAIEPWRYLLRHPFRRFFVVDSAVSAASYCAYAKTYAGFAPTRDRPIPDAWWPLAEAGALALGGQRVPDAPREVWRFPAAVRDRAPQRPISDRSRAAADFFRELTHGDPRLGVLVMAPLTFVSYGYTVARYGVVRTLRSIRRRFSHGR